MFTNNFLKKYNIDFIKKASFAIKYNKKIDNIKDLEKEEYSIITIEKANELGYSLKKDGRILENNKNTVYKLEGIYIKDKEALKVFDKEFGSNIEIVNKITNKNYFFIFKKYFKKTFNEEEFTLAYNKKDFTIEKTYIKEDKIHKDSDSPALLIFDMKTKKMIKCGYFKNGLLHRENFKPAVIEYDIDTNEIKSYELCVNGNFHTTQVDKPSLYIEKNGFIKKYWHKNGKIDSINDNPALIYTKKSDKLFFDKDYDGFWIKDFIEDKEATSIFIHYKSGKIHREKDKAAIYSIDKNNKKIKEYFIQNHNIHREDLKPAYIDYKTQKASFFINGIDISKDLIDWSNKNNIDLSNVKKNDIKKYKTNFKNYYR